MADLKCTKCGITASYADADIADTRETCEETREIDGKEYTVSTTHNWIEI